MNRFKTAVLLTTLTLIMVALGSAIGGRGGMYLAFFMACAMNLFSYWFSDKIDRQTGTDGALKGGFFVD